MHIIAIASDLHTNSALGLLPPGAKRDDGQEVRQSKSQAWLWDNWLDYWKAVKKAAAGKKPLSVIVNGDWGDLNKHDGAQMLTNNVDTVIDWMVEALEPARKLTQNIYILRGTEAHTGGAGWMENRAAKEIGAVKDAGTGLPSFWTLRLQVERVRLFTTHHPGTNSNVPWTRGAAANRAAVKTALTFGGGARPDLAVFSHVHHSEDSADNHPVRAIFTPPWCLPDAFTYRIGHGWGTLEVGGLIIKVDGDQYTVIKRFYSLPEGEPQWQQA